jgi:hypothetical protein
MKKIIGFVLISFVFTSTAFAQNKPKDTKSSEPSRVKKLKKGDTAPFAGHLLNPRALADMVVKIKYSDQICTLNSQHKVDKLKIQLEKQKEQCKITVDSLTKLNKDMAEIQSKHINELSNVVAKTKKGFFEKMKDSSFWTGITVGIVTGVALSAGAYFAFK